MRAHSSDGFTLVELLVSLALGSMLIVILMAMLGDIRASWRRDGEAALATQAALVTRLDGLLTTIVAAEAGSGETVFEGGPRQLQALIPAPQAVTGAGLVRLTLEVEPIEVGAALVARLAPESGDEALPEQLRMPQVMATATDIRFSYLRRDAAGPVDSWAASATPPAAIRVEMLGRTRQLIVAQPVANADGRCLFDPVSLTCRLQTSAKAAKLAP